MSSRWNGAIRWAFFTVHDSRIAFPSGYWDKLSFLKMRGLPD